MLPEYCDQINHLFLFTLGAENSDNGEILDFVLWIGNSDNVIDMIILQRMIADCKDVFLSSMRHVLEKDNVTVVSVSNIDKDIKVHLKILEKDQLILLLAKLENGDLRNEILQEIMSTDFCKRLIRSYNSEHFKLVIETLDGKIADSSNYQDYFPQTQENGKV